MRKFDAIWLASWILLWLTLLIAFLIDYMGIVETTNLGFVETIWITWMLWTVILGFALAIVTRLVLKE